MGTTGRENSISLDSICSCKVCNHRLANDCIVIGCSCCGMSNHIMVLDGIQGFLPSEENNDQRQKGG